MSKARDRRLQERSGLKEFFETAIEELRLNPVCQNCGSPINFNYQPHHNVAHILPKQRYKSVNSHPDNRLFLCASKDFKKACHEKFDTGPSVAVEMPCFKIAVKKFQSFKDEVVERGKFFNILVEYGTNENSTE